MLYFLRYNKLKCHAIDINMFINGTGENYHNYHIHSKSQVSMHPNMYKQPGIDIPYYLIIYPLSKLKIIYLK